MTHHHSNSLPPGSVIGILGGGQLGRMLALAAARLGFVTHIYTPEAGSPAAQVAAKTVIGNYDDVEALKTFARQVDVITYEFENVPTQTAKTVAIFAPIHPPIKALETAQDRLTEKDFISRQAEVPVAPYKEVNNGYDAKRALKSLNEKVVIKTRRMGYDGKGQRIVETDAEAIAAYSELGDVACVAEKFIPFTREVSIIAARNTQGEIVTYPLIENEHRNHILHRSVCPAPNDDGQAQKHATKILEALDYVGVLAVEFFQLSNGDLLVNEIAPRVHNSGHWTQDAGCTDQFEMHIRAITGWPLGNSMPIHKTEMTNLLGEDLLEWAELAADPNVKIHLYGKTEVRAGRKMGHVNRILKD